MTLDETNAVGNVYFAHYLHWQGHCREMFLAQHAPATAAAIAAGSLAMVTVSCSMDYYVECYAFDDVEVLMTLGSTAGNRVSMRFDFGRGEQLVARGAQTVACMSRRPEGVMPAPLPADLVTALARFS
ncbi:acyl-CoA thioesterase [Blastococcus montanus]|uniref:acyl-CoA thioesterase n=1 Tax=Blastococcus montanus TaxID=3144973 RepID=UPI00320A66BE